MTLKYTNRQSVVLKPKVFKYFGWISNRENVTLGFAKLVAVIFWFSDSTIDWVNIGRWIYKENKHLLQLYSLLLGVSVSQNAQYQGPDTITPARSEPLTVLLDTPVLDMSRWLFCTLWLSAGLSNTGEKRITIVKFHIGRYWCRLYLTTCVHSKGWGQLVISQNINPMTFFDINNQ